MDFFHFKHSSPNGDRYLKIRHEMGWTKVTQAAGYDIQKGGGEQLQWP